MVQRYHSTHPDAGMNFYQTYPTVAGAGQGFPSVPSAAQELGIELGTAVGGSLNTKWLFVQMSGAASVAGGGTINVAPLSFLATQATVAGGTAGTVLVNVSSVTGNCWCEISGATITTTPGTLSGEEVENPGTPDAKAASSSASSASHSSSSSSSSKAHA